MNRIAMLVAILMEAGTSWIYMNRLFGKRRTVLLRLWTHTVAYLSLYLLSFIGNTYVNVISFGVVNFLLVAFAYECLIPEAIFHGGLLTLLMVMTESLVIYLIGFAIEDFGAVWNQALPFLALVVGSKLLYFACSFGLTFVFGQVEWNSSRKRVEKMTFLLTPIFASGIMLLLIQLSGVQELNKIGGLLVLISVFLLLAENVGLLFMLWKLNIQERENSELRARIIAGENRSENLTLLEEAYEKQRSIIHDVNHHLAIVRDLITDDSKEEALKYMNELKIEKGWTRINYSNNAYMNRLLWACHQKCQQNGIRFETDIAAKDLSMISGIDTVTVFGNLLDNAFEAAKDSEKPFVEVRSRVVDRITPGIIFMVINSCRQAPVVDEKGHLISQKTDQNIHGIGIRNIESVLKTYSTEYMWDYEQKTKQFCYYILFKEGKHDKTGQAGDS